MDWQNVKDCLDKLFEDPQSNDSEIIRIHRKIIKDTDSSISEEVIQFLNKKDVQLLEPELVKILKKNRLEANSYLLVANDLLNLEDFKDDLLNGDVVTSVAPPNTLRKLNTELSPSSVHNIPKTQAAMMPTNTQSQDIRYGVASSSQDINRLAIKLKDKCTYSKRVKGNFFSYLLDLKEVSTFSGASSYIKRFSMGNPDLEMTSAARKTILLTGATGSGKTTWINAMVNYILGVELNDPFRFLLIDEKIRGGSQAHSQTESVTAYDLHYQDGFRIPFSLTIVDTPGFNDTRGIVRDKEITATIKEFFEHKSGIQELDAVGFVVKSSDGRLTDSQKYIFNSILSIFGKDVKENIRFLATFADGNPPLVLEAIKEAELPCLMDSNGLPSHQSFNNGFIYQFKQQTTNDALLEAQWENGMKNFKSFFNELSSMTTKSLSMTKEVLEKRHSLQIQIQYIDAFKDEQQKKLEELRKLKEQISLNEAHVKANMNFDLKWTVSKKVKVPANSFSALNCNNCQITCHYPCNESWFEACPVFSQNVTRLVRLLRFVPIPYVICSTIEIAGSLIGKLVTINKPCIVCPQGCLQKHHTKEDTRWAFAEEEVTQTLYDVRTKYEEAIGKKLDADELRSALEAEIEQNESNFRIAVEEKTRIMNELKIIALTGDSQRTPEQCCMQQTQNIANEDGFTE